MFATKKYGRRYPWPYWFRLARRKGGLTLRKGSDYNGRTGTFAGQIRNRVTGTDVRIRIRIADDELSLTLWVRK